MNNIVAQATRNTRKSPWRIVLAVGALTAMVAGTAPAAAMDQQATEAQRDNAANWGVTAPFTGAYAYGGAGAPHRSGPYASARPSEPAAAAPAKKDFQDYK